MDKVVDQSSSRRCMEKQEEIDKLRGGLKCFADFRSLFDKRHYERLKTKTPSLKEAEALYQREALKREQIDALKDELKDIEKNIDSLMMKPI
jgi:hypothetical protein